MASKKSSPYILIWQRQNNLLNLPVGLATSVSDMHESDTLICDECGKIPEMKDQKVLQQRYECSNCKKMYHSIGYIKKRYSRRHDIVYDTDEKRAFLEMALDREIVVIKEVPIDEAVSRHAELFNAFNSLEIFSNDSEKFKQAIQQIHKFLYEKTALLCEANYRGDNFMGYIIATENGKLILVKLKDEKTLKIPYQVNAYGTMTLMDFVSKKTQKEAEFYEFIKSGQKPIIEKKKEIVPIISENFFD